MQDTARARPGGLLLFLLVVWCVAVTSVRCEAFSTPIGSGPDPQFVADTVVRVPKDWNPKYGTYGGRAVPSCKRGEYGDHCRELPSPVHIDGRKK